MTLKLVTTLLAFALFNQTATAQSSTLSSHQQLARSIFKELIEINTTHALGSTTVAAEAMSRRLAAAGFSKNDIHVVGPTTVNKSLVVRLRGTNKKRPILFLAHLDVVEARREDWSFDPFIFREEDGFFYGRGTMDIKDGAAILLTDFIRLKQEGYVPDRDLILALTAGEESGADGNGVEWLLKNQRSLIDAEFCINMDAGDPQMKSGRRVSRTVQASEKGVLDLNLEVKNPGGHSSLPTQENAIYRLANGLAKIAAYHFPVEINEVTRAYFKTMATMESGQLAADMKAVSENPKDTAAVSRLQASPYYNALMCTTCVATILQAGHAMNALPQTAKATINCRVLPGTREQDIVEAIKSTIKDTQIAVTVLSHLPDNPASALTPERMQPVEDVTRKLWPGVVVLPVMEVGATDGIYLRGAGIPTYGVSGVFIDVDDVRAHGKDERIGVKEFYDGLEYEYHLIKAFSSSR